MINHLGLSLPENDEELNTRISNLNQAYDKYFSFNVGSKRFEKHRDCYCEGVLNLTNGAYQQLKSIWRAHLWDFSNTDTNACLYAEFNTGVKNLIGVVADPIAIDMLRIIRINFPLFEENIAEFTTGSVSDLHVDSLEMFSTLKGSNIESHEIQSKGVVIGFTYQKEHADLLNAILGDDLNLDACCYLPEKHDYLEQRWNDYACKESDFSPYPLLLTLRKESMDTYLKIQCDTVIMTPNNVKYGRGDNFVELQYDKASDTVMYGGQSFDFIACYPVTGYLMSSSVADEQLSGDVIINTSSEEVPCDSVEWFANDRFEITPFNGDHDSMFDIHHSIPGAAIIVSSKKGLA
jgi:hypothetical protein